MNFISNLSDKSFLEKDSNNIQENSFHYTNFWHGIKKRKCMQCQYFHNCRLLCWSVINHTSFGLSQCGLKRTYDYIKNNNKIDEYLNWRQNQYSQEKYSIWFDK